MKQWKILGAFVAIFLVAYYLPLSNPKVTTALIEGFKLLQWYARNHTLACVVPALFIAGAIVTFLSQASVIRYLGPNSNRLLAYTVASVSGTILAVCSCSVLPMFAGIYTLGAGLGPASAFLYSGPAINVMALFLTARVLGLELGLARAIGAVAFAFAIGLAMAGIFARQEHAKAQATMQAPEPSAPKRSLWQTVVFMACMVAFLIFSDWFNPGNAVIHQTDGSTLRGVVLQEMRDEVMIQVQESRDGLRAGDRLVLSKGDIARIDQVESWVMDVYRIRWYLAGLIALAIAGMTWRWFERDEVRDWMLNTWDFAKLLIPLLYGGVFLVGVIGALLPEEYIAKLLGDNGIRSNLMASVVGALFYFATLTEIPIVQALTERGMASGPALALLLAGPAVSLPNILVIRQVLGTARTTVFCGLVVVMSTVVGVIYGALVVG